MFGGLDLQHRRWPRVEKGVENSNGSRKRSSNCSIKRRSGTTAPPEDPKSHQALPGKPQKDPVVKDKIF